MPVVKSCTAFLKLCVIIHSAAEPITWYASTTNKICIKEIFFDRLATTPAITASKQDFINIAGNTNAGGMPNKRLFTTGDNTAVSNPTFIPNL